MRCLCECCRDVSSVWVLSLCLSQTQTQTHGGSTIYRYRYVSSVWVLSVCLRLKHKPSVDLQYIDIDMFHQFGYCLCVCLRLKHKPSVNLQYRFRFKRIKCEKEINKEKWWQNRNHAHFPLNDDRNHAHFPLKLAIFIFAKKHVNHSLGLG